MLGSLYCRTVSTAWRADLRARARKVRRSGVERSLLVLPREDLARARLSTRGRGGAGRITGALPKDLEQQRQMLTAEVLMSQGRFADALAALEAWKKPGDEWVGYAKYNVGVALVRLGKIEDGARVLDEVASSTRRPHNSQALRTRRTSRSAMRGCGRRGLSRRSLRSSACGSKAHSRTRRCSASAGRTRKQELSRRARAVARAERPQLA